MNDFILPPLEPSWQHMLDAQLHKPYFKKLEEFLRIEYERKQVIYPENGVNKDDIFSSNFRCQP